MDETIISRENRCADPAEVEQLAPDLAQMPFLPTDETQP